MLPPGVKLVPHLDRSDLVHYTTHTVLRNLTDGVLLVTLVLFLFLGNVRSALIVTITIPFSLLFAAILLDLSHIPANLLSLGASGLRHGGGWLGGDGGEHSAPQPSTAGARTRFWR